MQINSYNFLLDENLWLFALKTAQHQTQNVHLYPMYDWVQVSNQNSLLSMVENECALDISKRDFGKRPDIPVDYFKDRTTKQ